MIILQCISVLFLFCIGVTGIAQIIKSLKKNDAIEFVVSFIGTISVFAGMYYTYIQIKF